MASGCNAQHLLTHHERLNSHTRRRDVCKRRCAALFCQRHRQLNQKLHGVRACSRSYLHCFESHSYSIRLRDANFTLLNLREPDTAMLVDRFVNYSVSDSTLSALFVDQFDFRSNKEYNINVENVVFTNYMSNILIYMSNILVSMVSLHSLVIRECIFRDNAYASLVELNSFSLNGRDTFFVNSYETYHLSYSKFQFVRDTFLLKDYGSKNARVIVKYNSNCSHNYLIEFVFNYN